jgi:hypothetical protein
MAIVVRSTKRMGAVPAISGGMKTPPHQAGKKQTPSEEITGLESALARAYARLRERARAAWERQQAGTKDPAAACVSVRITGTKASSSQPILTLKPAPTLRVRKPRKPRRNIPRAKDRSRK